MQVYLTRTKAVAVATYAQASSRVLAFIKNGDLGAGCGSSLEPFTGGKIVDDRGNAIAHVSYNGRVWPGTEWKPDSKPLYDPK